MSVSRASGVPAPSPRHPTPPRPPWPLCPHLHVPSTPGLLSPTLSTLLWSFSCRPSPAPPPVCLCVSLPPHAMTPHTILKLCRVAGQPVSLTPSGCARGPGSRPVPGSPPSGGHATSLYVRFSSPRRGPSTLSPSLRRPWRGGCGVPSVHLSGCQPCHPDTCLTCLTRAMPVASPPCGLCVGRGWGPGLAPSGWTAGAWSWNRPLATGTIRWGTAGGTRGGGSHPRPSRGPAGGVPAAPGV